MEISQNVQNLINQQESHNFRFALRNRPIDWLCKVRIKSVSEEWEMLIHDENHYLNSSKPVLCYYLMLVSLEDFLECEDYLEWTKEYMIKAPEFLEEYKQLSKTYVEIESILGKIDSLISPFDFEMRAGEFDELLRLEK